jgi:choice-of-anchor B domain-containing protein
MMRYIGLLLTLWVNMPLLFAQNQMELLGTKFYADGLSSLWGYTDPNGHEYALVGVKSGTSIVDITNPAEPNELFFVPDDFNIWREIKTWQQYAYVVDEVNGGVTIIDLSQLPDTVFVSQFTDNGRVRRVHSLWIDEYGFLYLNGFNNADLNVPTHQRGVMMYDLNPDLKNPTYINTYSANYAHDSYVRNNMMYTSEIYAGQVGIVDISDKLNPVLLATQSTPYAFTHNVWLSDNSQYMFTTDEKNGATLTAYDISDLSDIKELDRYQAFPGTNTMPHNVHVLNDFIILSYYTAGFRVIDAHEPDNLIETEYYDTSPDVGSGSSGCWGVYQYLPSGNLIASDRQQGLFITRPIYQRASYLQGTVSDALSGNTLTGVRVSIVGTTHFDHSQFGGIYKTGTANSGTYTVLFEKYGYEPLSVEGVELNAAQYTDLNVQMTPLAPFTMQLNIHNSAGMPLPNVGVEVRNSWANASNGIYTIYTNEMGIAIIADLYNDNYTISASKWGQLPIFPFETAVNNASANLDLVMQQGYYDDFATDLGWTTQQLPDTLHGAWLRDAPSGTQGTTACTFYNDISTDWSNKCYVTGNGYAVPEMVDLDSGITRIISPPLNLEDYNSATLHFALLYCLAEGAVAEQSAFNIYNGANGNLLFSTNLIDSLQNGTNGWQLFSLPLDALIAETPATNLVIEATNNSNTGITEFAFDGFHISSNSAVGIAPTPKHTTLLMAQPSVFAQNTQINMANVANNKPQLVQIYNIYGQLIAQKQLLPNSTWHWGDQVTAGVYVIKTADTAIKVLKTE